MFVCLLSLAWTGVLVPVVLYLRPAPDIGLNDVRRLPQPKHRPVWLLPKAPREGAQRDGHFQEVLQQLTSNARQEAFQAIFDINDWGCDTMISVHLFSCTALQLRVPASH